MTRSSNRRRGFSAVEVAIASIMLSAAIIPLYLLFRKTGETSWRSEVAYKALQVAREEMEEVRLLPIFPGQAQTPYRGHDWEEVSGKSLFARYYGATGASGGLADPKFTYDPQAYVGISTRLSVLEPPVQGAGPEHPDVRNTRIIRLEVRWGQKGQVNETGRKGTQVFHEVIVNRGGGR